MSSHSVVEPELEEAQAHSHAEHEHHEHTHSYAEHEQHEHAHSHQRTKLIYDRLSRAGGHLESVKRMLLSGRDCSEVLIQLSAVIAALNSAGKLILKDHMENCILDAVESGDMQALEELERAIDRFIR